MEWKKLGKGEVMELIGIVKTAIFNEHYRTNVCNKPRFATVCEMGCCIDLFGLKAHTWNDKEVLFWNGEYWVDYRHIKK